MQTAALAAMPVAGAQGRTGHEERQGKGLAVLDPLHTHVDRRQGVVQEVRVHPRLEHCAHVSDGHDAEQGPHPARPGADKGQAGS